VRESGGQVARKLEPMAEAPTPGAHAACANCGAVLQGPYCHACGQSTDTHKRSIVHLIWELLESLFHLDGRLARTLPDLFLRPGRLARDYMEGRIARHVPPFRTFLVALLLFIVAAEYATHRAALANERQAEARAAALATPQGRAAEAVRIRKDAVEDRAEALKDAAQDRAESLRDPDERRERIAATYAKSLRKAQARYGEALAKADRVARGEPAPPPAKSAPASENWFKSAISKATANPEYYFNVLFAWGHRLAILLLPIVGLSLALVYRNRRQYFIYDHLLVAMNLLSFGFLANGLGLVLPVAVMPLWLGLVAIWTPVNIFQTLRGAYGSSILGAALKAVIVWTTTVTAFSLLLIGLLIFSLAQL
jgi:hypothetical protein